ncbi:hypothetical protein DPEC_G00153040 [Dallia pectoralis]|uniref:Uncharacterized protein n=1 Tax=Dallia pectoralis TaxID=75939 RepID=A0ACC2GK31_DALPE|nr:hypothetical protein DPEC_G00153040 [Dallia pectoralis]
MAVDWVYQKCPAGIFHGHLGCGLGQHPMTCRRKPTRVPGSLFEWVVAGLAGADDLTVSLSWLVPLPPSSVHYPCPDLRGLSCLW